MADFKEDTRQVKEEYEGLSDSTHIFIWAMVGIGVLIGLLLGGAIAYGVAVEEQEGRDCIEYESEFYCAGGPEAEQAETADTEGGAEGEVGGDEAEGTG